MPKKIPNFVLRLKRFSFFCVFLLSYLFFSCSNPVQSDISEETATLRYAAESLYDSTEWTEEIEIDRLTASVSSVKGISPRLNLSPLIVLASAPSDSSRIFPSMGGFGSLDTSLIPEALRVMLSAFSERIAAGMEADSFMAESCLYSLALFYDDFRRIFDKCFDFSDTVEMAYFTSFVLGEPFLDGVYYEVPVKFFGEKATVTLCVFCFEKSGAWKIDQIQIADWEILNGKN